MTAVGLSAVWGEWALLMFPLCGAAVAWVSGWLVTLSLFWPLARLGGVLQGAVPANAKAFSERLVGLVLPSNSRLHELFQHLEPEVLSSYLVSRADNRIEWLVDSVLSEHHALLWENLPRSIKLQVYERVRVRLAPVIDGIVEELCEHIDDLVDGRALLCRRLEAEPEVLVRLYKAILQRDLRRVQRGFGVVGFVIGLAGVLVVLAGGDFRGWGWLMGFSAVAPVLLGRHLLFSIGLPASLRGHRADVERHLADVLASDMLSVSTVVGEAFAGEAGGRAAGIVRRHMEVFFDDVWWRPALRLALGAEGFAELRVLARERAVPMLVGPLRSAVFASSRQERIRHQLLFWLGELSDEQFQGLGRSLFEVPRWYLLAVAGVWGAVCVLVSRFLFVV